jgi:hypothetical protein
MVVRSKIGPLGSGSGGQREKNGKSDHRQHSHGVDTNKFSRMKATSSG